MEKKIYVLEEMSFFKLECRWRKDDVRYFSTFAKAHAAVESAIAKYRAACPHGKLDELTRTDRAVKRYMFHTAKSGAKDWSIYEETLF